EQVRRLDQHEIREAERRRSESHHLVGDRIVGERRLRAVLVEDEERGACIIGLELGVREHPPMAADPDEEVEEKDRCENEQTRNVPAPPWQEGPKGQAW